MGRVSRLSGRDERKNPKSPRCPLCGRNPRYWIIDGDPELGMAIGWLVSDGYLRDSYYIKKHVLLAKKLNHMNIPDFVQKIYQVRCSAKKEHVFRGDAPILRIVKNTVLRYSNVEGHEINR